MAASQNAEGKPVLQELQEENSLQPIFADDFDSKTFATQIIQYQAVGETLGKLEGSITRLDDELYRQVVAHHEDLLSQVTGIEALEGVLKMMQARIETLRSTLDRVTARVSEPHAKIVSRTRQLSRLQSSCDLLRKIIRMLYLLKRLKALMQAGTREITKVAQTFSEIDQLSQGPDLNGIQVVEEERLWLVKARREVEVQAKRMLAQGLELSNPAQVGVAIQVFQSLGQFQEVLLGFVEECRSTVQREIQVALDPATLAPPPSAQQTHASIPGRAATMPAVGSMASWRATLWARLETLADNMERTFVKVQQLRVVLEKRRDPVTQESLLEQIRESEAYKLLTTFWDMTADNLALEFTTAARASPFLSQTFETDYPRLVVLFVRLLDRLEQQRRGGRGADPTDEQQRKEREVVLMRAFAAFEKTYLSKSLSRLFDLVNQMFASSTRGPPSDFEVTAFVKAIHLELSGSVTSEQLSLLIAKNVQKSIKLFVMKCEQMTVTGQYTLQVVTAPNEAQLKNISIGNCLHFLTVQTTEEVFGRLELRAAVWRCISEALSGVVEQRDRFLVSLLSEVRKILEVMIIRMHEEDFSRNVKSTSLEAQCSSYIKELQEFISRIATEFVSKFKFVSDARHHLHEMTCRIIDVFVRHVCLVRPLGEEGKLKITADIAQFEFALAPLCTHTSVLGVHARMLQGLRHLLFLSAQHIVSEESKGLLNYFPLSYLILQLVSRAPPEAVSSPLQVHGWSMTEFSQWLDKHESEGERLAALKPSLDQLVAHDPCLQYLQELCIQKLTS